MKQSPPPQGEQLLNILGWILEDNNGRVNITPRAITDFQRTAGKFSVSIKPEDDGSITLNLEKDAALSA
ncbi:MAG TPA: hypothetical protein VD994_07850 [Prosthecobacter sp.]|nr:hypothetical protein [Prosthecobacter sp.]